MNTCADACFSFCPIDGDSLAIHVALGRAQPGDVLIVAGRHCLERALVGELSRSYAIQRGVAGIVMMVATGRG